MIHNIYSDGNHKNYHLQKKEKRKQERKEKEMSSLMRSKVIIPTFMFQIEHETDQSDGGGGGLMVRGWGG